MRTQPFTRTATVTLDSSGNGTAATGPQVTNEVWTVNVAAVRASANLSEATAVVSAAGSFIDGTTWGSTGDSTSNFSSPVYCGQQVTATWTGGNPGAIATLTVQGTRKVP